MQTMRTAMDQLSAVVRGAASLEAFVTRDRSRRTITVSMALNVCRAAALAMCVPLSFSVLRRARLTRTVQASHAAPLDIARGVPVYANKE